MMFLAAVDDGELPFVAVQHGGELVGHDGAGGAGSEYDEFFHGKY